MICHPQRGVSVLRFCPNLLTAFAGLLYDLVPQTAFPCCCGLTNLGRVHSQESLVSNCRGETKNAYARLARSNSYWHIGGIFHLRSIFEMSFANGESKLAQTASSFLPFFFSYGGSLNMGIW
jgi:hypothetical protein